MNEIEKIIIRFWSFVTGWSPKMQGYLCFWKLQIHNCAKTALVSGICVYHFHKCTWKW